MGFTFSSNFPTTPGAFQTAFGGGGSDAFISKISFGRIPFSSFSGKLELDPEDGSFDLNASFALGVGGSINPPTQPVSLTIGTYSVTIPAGSFLKHHGGYRFEGVIDGVRLEVLIKHPRCDEDDDHSDVEPPRDNGCVRCACRANSYKFLAEGRGANLKGTTNPVTVTLSIGDDMGTTKIHAELE